MIISILSAVVVILLTLYIYKKGRANEDFFKDWRIKYSKPTFMFGHSQKMMARKENIFEFIKRIYNEFPEEKAVGMWEMRNPVVIIRDLQLLKYMTVKVFDNFMDHKMFIDVEADPLFGNILSALTGQKWKDMRATISPAFTGSKMRSMLELINEVTEQLMVYLRVESDKSSSAVLEFEMKDLCSRYTNDVIALCSFGIKVDSLKDRENEFYTMGKSLMDFGKFRAVFILMVLRFFPWIGKMLKVTLISKATRRFFTDAILSTIEYREKNNVHRPDMISLLMDAREGALKHNSEPEESKSEGFATIEEPEQVRKQDPKKKWTDEELIAQCFVFFLGGFENNSTIMTLAAYELATSPDVQQKLFEEVSAMRESVTSQGISYENLHEMKYLDAVVCEALRKWPPAGMTDRVCNQEFNYKDEETDLEMHFKKGDQFWMPIYGFHMDPLYFPEPEKFYPDRFLEENRHLINADAFLPFGLGPRVCPANRFVLMAVKAFLYYLVQNFEVVVVEKTEIPLKFKNDFNSIAKDIHLGLKRRV